MRAYRLLLVFATLLSSSAANCADETPNQPVTISAKRLMLSEALARLEDQTSLKFRLKDPATGNRLISIWVKDQPLQDVMSAIAHVMDMRWRKIGDPLTGYRLESDKAQQEPDWQALEKEALEKFWETVEILKLDDNQLTEVTQKPQSEVNFHTHIASRMLLRLHNRNELYRFLSERQELIAQHLASDVTLRFTTKATDEDWKLPRSIYAESLSDKNYSGSDWTFCEIACLRNLDRVSITLQIGGKLQNNEGNLLYTQGTRIPMATILVTSDVADSLPPSDLTGITNYTIPPFQPGSLSSLLGLPKGDYTVNQFSPQLQDKLPWTKGDIVSHLAKHSGLNIVADEYNHFDKTASLAGETVHNVLQSLREHPRHPARSYSSLRGNIVVLKSSNAAQALDEELPEPVRRTIVESVLGNRMDTLEALRLSSGLTETQWLHLAIGAAPAGIGLTANASHDPSFSHLMSLMKSLKKEEVRQFPTSDLSITQKQMLAKSLSRNRLDTPLAENRDSWGVIYRDGNPDGSLPAWFSVFDKTSISYGYLIPPVEPEKLQPWLMTEKPANRFDTRSEMTKAVEKAYPDLTPQQRLALSYKRFDFRIDLTWPTENYKYYSATFICPLKWYTSPETTSSQTEE